ncbi:MAG: lysophospholipase L1-like esterase [Nocardioides sp.]|nr:lysophospholipase L1-like esterase [Nocardioides sp.]
MTLRLPRLGPVLGLVLLAVAVSGCKDETAAVPDDTPRHGLVAIIGDSYMAGADPSDPGSGMAGKVADDLGMNLSNFSVGGTGYLRGGLTGAQEYDAQATLSLTSDADLYIVYGGANDWIAINEGSQSLDDLATAARGVFTKLGDGARKADVVVVGPIWPAVTPDPGILEIRDVLKREAEAAGLTFIDPIEEQWLTADNLEEVIGADNIHPSAAGNIYFGQRVADAVEAVVH